MLTREQILKHLQQLGVELDAAGVQGEILLTGGAAMCLVHEARDMTKDIDALYEPKELINSLVTKIAEREGLPSDWLNDSVKGFVGTNAPVGDFMTFKGLRILSVSSEYLLAMKLMAARYGEKDSDDIFFLMNKLGIATEEQLTEILLSFFPANRVLPKTQYVIEEMVERIHERRREQDPSLLDELEDAKREAQNHNVSAKHRKSEKDK